MTEKNKKPQENPCIQGVECNVQNCVYNDGKRYCRADQIKVGPDYAVSFTETACATFKNKL